MRIAFLVSTFPPHIGGMGRVCFEEAKRLSDKHQVTVITLDYGSCQYADEKFPFKVRRIKPLLRIGDGGWLVNLSRELAGFDLVHLHYPFYGAAGSLITAKKLIGFPFVVTYHMDPQGNGLKRILQNLYDLLYSKILFRLADRVIAVDEDYFNVSKCGRYIDKKKLLILPNCVDTDIFKPDNSDWSSTGLPELKEKKTVLFVGNFLAVKNLEFLFEIFPRFKDETVLLIVGGGYDEKRLKALVKNTVYEKRVIFIGSVNDEKRLSAFYRAADLVAVPSRSESFSLVAVEAMASGGVVLANNIPGIKSRIIDGVDGFLAKLDDQNDWVEKAEMIFSLSGVERQEISSRARAKLMDCSWNSHIDSLEKIYQDYI